MKKLNFWKLLFSAMFVFAATAFTSCVDDNEDNGIPYITAAPATIAYDALGHTDGNSYVMVNSNRPWVLNMSDADKTWITVSAEEGQPGQTKVEISVSESDMPRLGTLNFQLMNTYGAYKTATVTINQGNAVPSGILPTQIVTSFGENFASVTSGAVYQSSRWAFLSNDPAYPATANRGWVGSTFTDGSAYIQCAPFSSALNPVIAYAVMTPFNVKDAADKTLTFKLAWFANKTSSSIDNTKIELVASTTVTDETASDSDQWAVVGDPIQWMDDVAFPFNTYNAITRDLSAYADKDRVYFAFRYTGHNNTYRLDDISFNGGTPQNLIVTPDPLTLTSEIGAEGTLTVTATDPWTATIDAAGTGKFTIDNTSGAGDGTIKVTAAVANSTTGIVELGKITVSSVAGDKTVTIKQKPLSNDIYYETFGSPTMTYGNGSQWPYIDQYVPQGASTGFVTTGYGFTGSSSYSGSQAGVRTLPDVTKNSPIPPCSGVGHVWFPTGKTYATNYFQINNLTLTTETNLHIEFVVNGSTTAYTVGDLKLEISKDGSDWKPVTFTVGAISGTTGTTTWQMATADFTLKNAVSSLYVKWSSETTGGVRMDDPKINVGAGGTEIDLGGGSTTPTISAVSPASLSWTASESGSGVAKTVTVTGTNLTDIDLSAVTGFTATKSAVTATGATVTVYPNAANASTTADLTATLTISATGNSSSSKPVSLTQIKQGGSAGTTAEFIFADFYSADTDLTTVNVTPITLTFAKASGATAPKYYVNGTAARMYENNTLTVTGGTITNIEFTFAAPIGADTYGHLSSTPGTFSGTTWSGSSNNIVFTVPTGGTPSKYQARIVKMVVTYAGSASTPAITGATPTSLSWANTETGAKTIAVTGTNLAGITTSTPTNFNVSVSGATATGATVTVTPKGTNMTAADYNETLTITATGGNNTTVSLTQTKPVAATPAITGATPTSLNWTDTETGAKTIAVTGTNLAGITTSTPTNFNVSVSGATATGATVTVTPKGTNTTAADYNETLTITATGGNNTTVSLTQTKPAAGGGQTVTMTASDVTGLPTAANTSTTSFTADGLSWSTYAGYKSAGQNYIMLQGNPKAYIQTPAIAGKTLKSITIRTGSGASTAATAKVVGTDSTDGQDNGTVFSAEQALNATSTDFTFTLTGSTPNTSYRFIATGTKNTQAVTLTLQYE